MVLQNYVILEPGRPSRMHFADHSIQVRTIHDPLTRQDKLVNTLVFTVDELDGRPVVGSYSIVSDKHSRDFLAFLPGQRYRGYDFIITQSGEGFRREYQVQSLPRTA